MKIERLIKDLQNIQLRHPNATIRLNSCFGHEALFACSLSDPQSESVVWLEGKDDVDMGEEISSRFRHAEEEQMDELDFFLDLIDIGITLKDIELYCPEKYEYSHHFMKEHGLLN